MKLSPALQWLLIALVAIPGAWLAYDFTAHPRAPTIEEYLAKAGPKVRRVEPGALELGGIKPTCGLRPTVLDDSLTDVAAAYPDFIILNPRVLPKIPPVIQLYAYTHECGHEMRGVSEEMADCYAAVTGRQQGWLTGMGIEAICDFWRPHVGDSVHLPGPERCALMQRCFARGESAAAGG